MNTYTCDKCDWQYAWTMGDRIKAVKRHQLAHLIEERDMSRSNLLNLPVAHVRDYRRRLVYVGLLGESGVHVS